MPSIRHLFWDFDGTLYDSYPNLLHSVMAGLEDAGFAGRFSETDVLRWIKVNVYHGIRVCADQLGLPMETVLDAYLVHHRQEKNFRPYDGLQECLQTLYDAGFRHYLYTHRDQSAVRQLQEDGLWHLFSDAVIKEDGFASKPAPDALNALMARNALTPDQCAMIGDRDIDIDAGHNARMSGVLFDPDGFYQGYPSEIQAQTMAELTQKLLSQP